MSVGVVDFQRLTSVKVTRANTGAAVSTAWPRTNVSATSLNRETTVRSVSKPNNFI